MGAVYLAEHSDARSASRKVIKILLPEFSRNPTIRERFEREALAVMRLKHQYIVEIDNFGALADGQLYLMMEYLDGETLETHLERRGRCSLHHALHVIAQVMSALACMHEAGLVHRDLKPANIFVVATEQNPYEVRLIDLGIARDLATTEGKKKTMTGLALGTPGYMAVEQYEDAASATPAADVYAAAVIVWRMLFGQAPWGEVFDERVLYFKQRTEDFEPPATHDVPAEVVALLRKALSKTPKERPTVADFVNLLASFTPEIPPFVPGGATILDRVASRFIKQASVNDETVRNLSHASVVTPMSWPHRGTAVARPAAPTTRSRPTANERATTALAPRTTMSASSGVVTVPPAPHSFQRARVFVAIGACVLAGVVAFSIVHMRRSPDEPPSAVPASQPASTAPDRTIAPDLVTPTVERPATTPPAAALPERQAGSDRPVPPPVPSSAAAPNAGVAPSKPPRRDTKPQVPTRTTAGTARPTMEVPPTAVKPAPAGARGSGSAARPPERFDPNAIVE